MTTPSRPYALLAVGELLAELRRRYPYGIDRQQSGGEDPTSSSALPSKSRLVLMRGPLTYLLANPIYIGKVRHHGTLHDGEHEPPADLEDPEQVSLGNAGITHGRESPG